MSGEMSAESSGHEAIFRLDESSTSERVSRTISTDSEDSEAHKGAGGMIAHTESDDDEELKMAKEMAMAIASNPHLTPDQIREMMKQQQQQSSAAKKKSSTSTIKKAASKVKSGVKSSVKSSGSVIKSTVKSTVKTSKTAVKTSVSTMKDVYKATVGISGTSGSKPHTLASTPGSPGAIPAIKEKQEGAEDGYSADTGDMKDSAKSEKAPRALGEFLEASSRNGDEDDMFPASVSMGQVRMTGIVWKRRSGFGKYSVSAAWERRRLMLRGSKLMYFRGDNADEHSLQGGEVSGDDSSAEGSGGGYGGIVSKTWLDQTMKQAAALTGSIAVSTTSTKGPRGGLDLVKENASVSASFGHSGAPTPFALSIKVLAQTKWKLCFDTHSELMQWLSAMTDAIVQGSVDVYNAQIVQASDPSYADSYYYHGQLSEPPLIAGSGQRAAESGHRLWVCGHYNVKSEGFPDQYDDVSDDELEDVQSDDEGMNSDDDATQGVRTKRMLSRSNTAMGAENYSVDPESQKDVFAFPENNLWQIATVFNLAVIIARASSTTIDTFWYLIVFANIGFFGFLSKEKVGGTVRQNNVVITPKMARRMSMESGVHVTPTVKAEKKKAATPAIPKDSADMAVAGTTTMRIENPNDLPVNKDGHVFAGWRFGDPAGMNVRSHGYKSTKAKVASPGELYECAQVDIFESGTRYPDMASRVKLPSVDYGDEGPKTWTAPDIFVVSISIPTDPPSLYGSSENGGGYTVTMYYKMKKETRDILKRVTADGYDPSKEEYPDGIQNSKVNAARLLDEWCRRAPTDDSWMARFKVLPNAHNLKEIGLPSWISKYNQKPFLIKRPGQTGFLYRHPEKSCYEFDVSLHPFPYLAKQGICYMKESYFKKILVTFGFLIEGRADDELPECLIGCMQLCYPDPIHTIQGEDFLEGRSAKSFTE